MTVAAAIPTEADLDAALAWLDSIDGAEMTDQLAALVLSGDASATTVARVQVLAQAMAILPLIDSGLSIEQAMGVVCRDGAISVQVNGNSVAVRLTYGDDESTE